jgi:hypothetical protein
MPWHDIEGVPVFLPLGLCQRRYPLFGRPPFRLILPFNPERPRNLRLYQIVVLQLPRRPLYYHRKSMNTLNSSIHKRKKY